jgi:hypothetical protein
MNRSIFLSYSVLGNSILLYLGRLKELEHTPSPSSPLNSLKKFLVLSPQQLPLQKGGETESVV